MPTEAEWVALGNAFGGVTVAGGALKSIGSSGFNALLGGHFANNGGVFSQLNGLGFYWTSDTPTAFTATSISFGISNTGPNPTVSVTNEGFSVRLIRD